MKARKFEITKDKKNILICYYSSNWDESYRLSLYRMEKESIGNDFSIDLVLINQKKIVGAEDILGALGAFSMVINQFLIA